MSPWTITALVIIALVLSWWTFGLLARRLRRRLERMTVRALRRFRVRLNRWKLSPKNEIRERLMRDEQVVAAIVEHARESGCKLGEAEARAEHYIDEIAPSFQAFWYYVFGHLVAGLVLNLVYRLELEDPASKVDPKLHQDKAVVYLANHRSNADYVLLSYALTGQVALSYAVGEWARVWPLETLFKAFGSYFIRRGFREELYHVVLRRYVQLITGRGITQGVFIEGGLSRDGALRPAKVGMLDYMTQALTEADFSKDDIVFVPVGLNYDRVLEDRPLTNEHLRALRKREAELAEDGETAKSAEEKPAEARKGRGALWRRRAAMARRSWKVLLGNVFKYWSRRLRKHGVAAVSYGQPISFKDWQASRGRDVLTMERGERLAEIAIFGEEVLDRVGKVIPATPVTLLCAAFEECGLDGPVAEQSLREAILRRLIAGESSGGSRAPVDLDREKALSWGRQLLSLRGLIIDRDDELEVVPEARVLVQYYASSLAASRPKVTEAA